MNSILKTIITLIIGIVVSSLVFILSNLYISETKGFNDISTTLITLTKEIINEKNFYSLSEKMLFTNEPLCYDIYLCGNDLYNVVLTDENGIDYCFNYVDTQYGIYYLGTQQPSSANKNVVASGEIIITDVYNPNYDLYQNYYDYFDYTAMCQNIISSNFAEYSDSIIVYALDSFYWDKAESGKPVLVILGDNAIITNASLTPTGYRLDKINYSISVTENESLIEKYKNNSIGFAIE